MGKAGSSQLVIEEIFSLKVKKLDSVIFDYKGWMQSNITFLLAISERSQTPIRMPGRSKGNQYTGGRFMGAIQPQRPIVST